MKVKVKIKSEWTPEELENFTSWLKYSIPGNAQVLSVKAKKKKKVKN